MSAQPAAPAAAPPAPRPGSEAPAQATEDGDAAADDTQSYGSLAERLQAMKVAKAAPASGSAPAAPKPVAATRKSRATAKKLTVIESTDEEEDDVVELDSDSSDGEPEIMSPHPSKARKPSASDKKTRQVRKGSMAAVSTASGSSAAPAKRKPAAARKPKAAAKPSVPASPAPPTPQASRMSTFDLESPSPALAHQGKVRRMRESPFHKGSGSNLDPVEEISDNLGEPEASPAPRQAHRPRRAAAVKKAYVIESDDSDEDSDIDIVDSDYEESD
mmetsp:Transcript_20607/g.57189  ORF Transcript_20607/g.57189 Transcript_20607/m.57189 type:complete len:274 (+) Transcript_20607:219-1040(+)